MVSPSFNWRSMDKEYTLRDAFIDFIVQYGELSRELQNSRLQYGNAMDVIRSKDDLIAESIDAITKMNKKIKDDQRYINILIEKLCIYNNFSREYLESLREEIENADRDGESEQQEEMEAPSVQQRAVPDDREESVEQDQQKER